MNDTAIIRRTNNVKLKEYSFIKILYNVSFYIITAVLLISGIAKIIDPLPLINTLKLITIIPASLHIIIATLLPVVEIGLAVLMLMKIKPKYALVLITMLFMLFLGISVYGAIAGFGADCGCFGSAVKSSFGWGMILRNTVLFIMSLILTINAWPGRITNN